MLSFIPVSVHVVGQKNKKSIQALYITNQLKSLFLSRTCLLELRHVHHSLKVTWHHVAARQEQRL